MHRFYYKFFTFTIAAISSLSSVVKAERPVIPYEGELHNSNLRGKFTQPTVPEEEFRPSYTLIEFKPTDVSEALFSLWGFQEGVQGQLKLKEQKIVIDTQGEMTLDEGHVELEKRKYPCQDGTDDIEQEVYKSITERQIEVKGEETPDINHYFTKTRKRYVDTSDLDIEEEN